MEEMERVNVRLTFIWWTILFVLGTMAMLWVASHKAIVIADAGHDPLPAGGKENNGFAWDGAEGRLMPLQPDDAEGYFEIPLEKGARAEDVAVENCYMDRELHIFIQGGSEDFYEDSAVRGDIRHIVSAGRAMQEQGVLIKLRMDGVWEYKSSLENGMLRIEPCAPGELYRMIVVVDPAQEGLQEEKDEMLQVAGLLQKKWANDSVRIYFTSAGEQEPDDSRKAEFAEAAGADLYVRICLARSEDEKRYGICGKYNDQYFIPGFGNVALADVLVRNVTIACQNRAVGLQPAEEDGILQMLRIPAAQAELGYLTNERERELLAQEAYREKLAEGLAKALTEVYESYYE